MDVTCPTGYFELTAYDSVSVRAYLAVKVKVSECVVLGDKIKAPRCKVLHEVNDDGDPLPGAS